MCDRHSSLMTTDQPAPTEGAARREWETEPTFVVFDPARGVSIECVNRESCDAALAESDAARVAAEADVSDLILNREAALQDLETSRQYGEEQFRRAEAADERVRQAEKRVAELELVVHPLTPAEAEAVNDLTVLMQAGDAKSEIAKLRREREELDVRLDFAEVWFSNLYPADWDRCMEKYAALAHPAADPEGD